MILKAAAAAAEDGGRHIHMDGQAGGTCVGTVNGGERKRGVERQAEGSNVRSIFSSIGLKGIPYIEHSKHNLIKVGENQLHLPAKMGRERSIRRGINRHSANF